MVCRGSSTVVCTSTAVSNNHWFLYSNTGNFARIEWGICWIGATARICFVIVEISEAELATAASSAFKNVLQVHFTVDGDEIPRLCNTNAVEVVDHTFEHVEAQEELFCIFETLFQEILVFASHLE